MITVAFTISCQREKYLRQALDSWACVRGIQDVHLLFSCEPSHKGKARWFPLAEFTAWVTANFPSVQVAEATTHLGCSANTRRALELAFEGGAEFTILAEEDLIVSTDVLEYFCWAQGTYHNDVRVKSVCAHAMTCAPGTPENSVVSVPWFSPLVWGTWRDRWESYVSQGWGGVELNPEGWDHNYRMRLHRDNFLSVFPAQSRSQHIGEQSSITGWPLSQYFYKASVSHCFERDRPPQKYQEVPRTPELGLVV